MKKIMLALLMVLIGIPGLFAQQFKIEKSAPFDEPDYGWNKLLQLKNGNTLLFHSTKRDGIDVTVYNKLRKQISTRTLESELWDVRKMKQSKIVGLYEIKGEPVLFIVQADGREPTLYRMRINPATGGRLNEVKMGNLPKLSFFAGYAMAFGKVDVPDIVVEKDPNSDCYAVIYFDGFAHDRSERIKVVHYDGDHKVINTAFYDSPDGKYKYLRYIGAAIDGNKRVFIATYGYNGKADEDKEPSVIVSKIDAVEKKFKHSLFKVSNEFNDTKSVMLFNQGTNKVQLLTLAYAKWGFPVWGGYLNGYNFSGRKTTSYLTMLSYIDPESLELINAVPIAGNKIDAYGKQNIEADYEYEGAAQNMVINKDNTSTILLEALTNIEETHSNGRTYYTTYKTKLGPVGISELNEKGEELAGYAINKKQMAGGTLPVLYMADRSKGIFSYNTTQGAKTYNNEFLSYDYIYTDKGRYVVFNDLPVNADRDEDEKKRKTVAYVSKTNTMCYKLDNLKMTELFLFGEPKDKSESTFCYIESSDYNKATNCYATMIVERNGRDKEAKIAWVTFE